MTDFLWVWALIAASLLSKELVIDRRLNKRFKEDFDAELQMVPEIVDQPKSRDVSLEFDKAVNSASIDQQDLSVNRTKVYENQILQQKKPRVNWTVFLLPISMGYYYVAGLYGIELLQG